MGEPLKRVVVRVSSDRLAAAAAVATLEADGLDAALSATDVGGMDPGLAFGTGGYAITVPVTEQADAEAILSTVDAEPQQLHGRTRPHRLLAVAVCAFFAVPGVIGTLVAASIRDVPVMIALGAYTCIWLVAIAFGATRARE